MTRAGGRVAALVLAAGASRRFGAVKLLAPLDGRPLLARSLAVAEAVLPGRVTLVLGAHGNDLAPHAGGARVIHNPRWAEGLSSSIAAGVASLGEEVDHVLLLLADQVALTPAHLAGLVDHHLSRVHPGISCARYGGVLGIPALFAREWFPTLLNLRGDRGARDLLRSDWARPAVADMPEAAIDIDTPEDLDSYR